MVAPTTGGRDVDAGAAAVASAGGGAGSPGLATKGAWGGVVL